ncbi:hypothetical protein ACN08P_15425 (plasmid) [Photobacterium leiognathi subsp. mandapamensis]|uniref:hypothetical protein n=1 Tax=Photobacterium leiognathi TaxID=553611 RepID=UPI0029815A40|nr:hypothetical protein [Photobacterium leiognathi]
MMTSLLLIASLGSYTSCTQVTESMEEAAIIAKSKAKALLAEDTGQQLINVYESLDIKEGIHGIAEIFNVTITNQTMADLSEVVTLHDEVKTIDGKQFYCVTVGSDETG